MSVTCDPGDVDGLFQGCNPREPFPTEFADQNDNARIRDNYHPRGWYLDRENLVPDSSGAGILFGGGFKAVDLYYLLTHEGADYYEFDLPFKSLPLNLSPNQDNLILFGVTQGEHGFLSRAKNVVTMDPDVLLLPVATWNFGGLVPSLDAETMKYTFDRAPETVLPARFDSQSWAWQRVDEIWAQCLVQFRHVFHGDGPTAYRAWPKTKITYGDEKCRTAPIVNRACLPNRPETQHDWASNPNGCLFGDWIYYHLEQDPRTRYKDSTPVADFYLRGAINVYFTPEFDSNDSVTMGMGCRGAHPFAIVSDQWVQYANLVSQGRVLAHELGHVFDIGTHVDRTIMSGKDDTDFVPELMCNEVRAYVISQYADILLNETLPSR